MSSKANLQSADVVSHSVAHYLLAIHQLRDEQGYARSIDVARHVKRTRGTVSVVLKRMFEEGLVDFDENHFVKLTPKGHQITHRVLGSKIAVSKFLHEVLGVNKEIALDDACRIEHHLSPETIQRLVVYLNKVNTASEAQMPHCPDVHDCHVCERECLIHFNTKN